MTLKNSRAPLLCHIKLCAPFHHHMWIQTGVWVRKRLCWVLTSVILTFDLWPWHYAWTSLLSMVITSENVMMIRWWEHSKKGVTDGRTDGRTEPFIELLGRSYNLLSRAAKYTYWVWYVETKLYRSYFTGIYLAKKIQSLNLLMGTGEGFIKADTT